MQHRNFERIVLLDDAIKRMHDIMMDQRPLDGDSLTLFLNEHNENKYIDYLTRNKNVVNALKSVIECSLSLTREVK